LTEWLYCRNGYRWLEDLTFLQFEFKLREYLKTHHYQEHKFTNLDISDFYAVYIESGLSFEEWIKKWKRRDRYDVNMFL